MFDIMKGFKINSKEHKYLTWKKIFKNVQERSRYEMRFKWMGGFVRGCFKWMAGFVGGFFK